MNNLIKTALVAAAVALSASLKAEDSYLYWMLDSDDLNGFTYDSTGANGWSYAQVKAFTGAGITGDNFLTVGGGTDTKFYSTTGDGTILDQLALLGNNADSMSYVLELWNEEGGVARSAVVSYSDISAFIVNTPTGNEFSGFKNFTAIPEPTSGMLLLLGIGALALRRKNQKKVQA